MSNLSSISALSMKAWSYRKSTSAGTSCDTCSAQVRDERNTICLGQWTFTTLDTK